LERHAYNASKAGVCGLTRGLSSTYAGKGITINAVCPGLFETEMTEEIFANKFILATFNKQVPVGRAGQLKEVVDTIMFLASDNSSYITGQCLAVDGGMSVSGF
jgi:gluconate 5-dehydrogenase